MAAVMAGEHLSGTPEHIHLGLALTYLVRESRLEIQDDFVRICVTLTIENWLNERDP